MQVSLCRDILKTDVYSPKRRRGEPGEEDGTDLLLPWQPLKDSELFESKEIFHTCPYTDFTFIPGGVPS
jgi:hypothetical protein